MKQFLLLIRENADYGNLSIEEMEATKNKTDLNFIKEKIAKINTV